uniref:C3orf23 n=1 Tax=Caligus rogercresseyi TaxID=217165 RepID=C1BQA0_CALRO|nr:C3orf23 [Caligus rogercresseyi]
MCFLGGVVSTKWLIQTRSLTSAQVSVALRPFYFLVHPDLFVKYPKEQIVNENSLKSLKSYLDEKENRHRVIKWTSQPQFRFYVKNPSQTPKELRSIQFALTETPDVKSAVSKVLKSFNLPTNYIDNIHPPPSKKQKFFRDIEDEEEPTRRPSKGSSDTLLIDWLESNVGTARERLSYCTPFRLEIERIRSQICNQFNISSIQWDCDLNTLHFRGALDSFKILAEGHEEVCRHLRHKNLIFGRKSGMSLQGDVVLFSGDIRYNWLNTIRQIPQEEEKLAKIPYLEQILSEILLNIQISHREFHPLTTVEDYRVRLLKVITAVNDAIGAGKVPKNFDLSSLKICIESESSPLMIAPSGEFVAPASSPGFLLINFIMEHLDEAHHKLQDFQLKKGEEKRLIRRCKEELGLIQFDKDDSITPDAMIDSCSRLLRAARSMKHLTHGNHFILTRYFSVQSDGSICLPFNWKEN